MAVEWAAMNTGVEVALLVPVAYLLGTFPSATLVARRRGVDVTAEGSGNPGASNTFRLLGWKAGALVFALDVAQGRARRRSSASRSTATGARYILGVAAVLGHVLPVTRRFKGGRGVATGAGVMLVIFPLLTLGDGRAVGRAGARSRTRRRSRRSRWRSRSRSRSRSRATKRVTSS